MKYISFDKYTYRPQPDERKFADKVAKLNLSTQKEVLHAIFVKAQILDVLSDGESRQPSDVSALPKSLSPAVDDEKASIDASANLDSGCDPNQFVEGVPTNTEESNLAQMSRKELEQYAMTLDNFVKSLITDLLRARFASGTVPVPCFLPMNNNFGNQAHQTPYRSQSDPVKFLEDFFARKKKIEDTFGKK